MNINKIINKKIMIKMKIVFNKIIMFIKKINLKIINLISLKIIKMNKKLTEAININLMKIKCQ